MTLSIRSSRALLLLIAAGTVTACGRATSTPPPVAPRGAVIDSVLAPQVGPVFQSEVLVLGTIHLAGLRDQLRPEHLQPLLARLEAFAPTRIAVESLTADEVALLAERETHDPAAAEVLRMFAQRTLTAGRTMQQALAVERIAAARRARAMLEGGRDSLSDQERLELVGYLLAAYEFDSATLQWSYLPQEVRARAESLPPEIHDVLDRRLESANEIVTLALPLARRLGLQRIYSIDSQYDGVRTLAAPRPALEELFSDPARGELRDVAEAKHAESVTEVAFAAGDLLPLYLYLNSDAHQRGDLTQWNWLFQGRHSSGLDRFRYAMWELRNLRQAMHIVDAAAAGSPERLLVIVGASHKAYLDRLLATQLSVRLVQLYELGEARPKAVTSEAAAIPQR